ncbi:hypothetical protein BYT27DRAFT_7230983 [Phlegmacium glaucopus]|nr:hypothetical protein BYT27DRAFT_7230983 [Phlegmacium glaucopus]
MAHRFADVLFPGRANIPANAFCVLFTITRHVPDPLPLASAEDYKHLLKCTGKMKTPMVKVILIDKENIPPAVIPTEKDILPGNVAKNDSIKRLRERWLCNFNNCKYKHCFVPADGPHFPLSHDHFNKWAAASELKKNTKTCESK